MAVGQEHLVASHVKSQRGLHSVSPVHVPGHRVDLVLPLGAQYLFQISFNITRVDQHIDRRFLSDGLAQQVMSSVRITNYKNFHPSPPGMCYKQFYKA